MIQQTSVWTNLHFPPFIYEQLRVTLPISCSTLWIYQISDLTPKTSHKWCRNLIWSKVGMRWFFYYVRMSVEWLIIEEFMEKMWLWWIAVVSHGRDWCKDFMRLKTEWNQCAGPTTRTIVAVHHRNLFLHLCYDVCNRAKRSTCEIFLQYLTPENSLLRFLTMAYVTVGISCGCLRVRTGFSCM